MALGGLLGLLDDVTNMMDDVAAMSKAAAQKTAGITGDDVAVNSLAAKGLEPSRELPLVWRVAKGSLKNKAILIPAALGLSAAAPAAITPLLMVGGAYFCYEGVEKVLHALRNRGKPHHHAALVTEDAADLKKLEDQKVKSAVRTDFVLSAEIVAVTLGMVAAAPIVSQLAVLATIGALMTVGVYGLVGAFVKLDDVGLHLSQRKRGGLRGRAQRSLGNAILRAAPKFMKGLTIAGTTAMLLVGGGLVLHGVPGAEHALHAIKEMAHLPGLAQGAFSMVVELAAGVGAGLVSIPLVKGAVAVGGRVRKPAAALLKKIKKNAPGAKSQSSPAVPAPRAEPVSRLKEKSARFRRALGIAARKAAKAETPVFSAHRQEPKP